MVAPRGLPPRTRCELHLDNLVREQMRTGRPDLAAWVERTVRGGAVVERTRRRTSLPLAPGVGHRRRGRRPGAPAPRPGRARAPHRDAVPDRRRGRGPRPAGSARPARASRLRALRRPVRPRHGPARGHVDLRSRPTTPSVDRLLEEYLEILARIYDDPARGRGRAPASTVPTDSAATGLAFLRRMQAGYDPCHGGPPADPIEVFLRRWLRDNVPQDRLASARFITYDSFQFMFDDGRITGLLDFEHAHVGDPMMDLAALRDPRHDQEPRRSRRDRGAVRGDHRCRDRPRRRSSTTPCSTTRCRCVSVGPPLADPVPGTDWISYLAWYVNGARWAFETIAEIRGYELEPVGELPEPRPSRHAPALRYLVDRPSRARGRDRRRLRARRARAHRQPPQARRRGRRRVRRRRPRRRSADLLGHRPDPADADAELVELIEHAGPERRGGARTAARRAGAAHAPHAWRHRSR